MIAAIEPYLLGAMAIGIVLAMLWGFVFCALKLMDMLTGDDNF